MAHPTLIVALDVPGLEEMRRLRERLDGAVDFYKVGSELFTGAGPAAIEELKRTGARVFLDLKFHDIPNTVARAVRAAARMGADLVDVHASGGKAMMAAAREAAAGSSCRLLAVSVLTHLGDEDLAPLGVGGSSREQVVRLARLARESGLDGMVASAAEIAAIREATSDELFVLVPGIRPSWVESRHDQKRVATPGQAARLGARYVVVGRAITESADPREAALRVRDELETV